MLITSFYLFSLFLFLLASMQIRVCQASEEINHKQQTAHTCMVYRDQWVIETDRKCEYAKLEVRKMKVEKEDDILWIQLF